MVKKIEELSLDQVEQTAVSLADQYKSAKGDGVVIQQLKQAVVDLFKDNKDHSSLQNMIAPGGQLALLIDHHRKFYCAFFNTQTRNQVDALRKDEFSWSCRAKFG